MPKKRGKLTMAGTCLGNPEDIPPRSLAALKAADVLVFEEDRPARQFLKAAGVHRDYLKLTEHGETPTLEAVRSALKAGQWVVYMSDQGMANVADPGQDLLSLGYELGAEVSVIPGPSSLTSALAACPFYQDQFFYAGFLSRKESLRNKELIAIGRRSEPTVILEAPYRRKALLDSCLSALGKNRRASLALDISGPNESFLVGNLKEIVNLSGKRTEKLNFVLILEGTTSSGTR
jgi:16S rRNA (cytidine1402-2'-O)-methyltransferase